MLPTVGETMTALTSEIEALLSPLPDPAPAREVLVSAGRTHPVGIGGFVGLHHEPRAELYARRLDAQVVVRLRAESLTDLLTAEARTVQDIIAADPGVLRSRGLQRLERVLEGPDRMMGPSNGLDVHVQELRFSVQFEHRPLPESGDHRLDTVPVAVATARIGPETGRRRYASEFPTNPLADFTVPSGGGDPVDWRYDEAAREVRHVSTLGGGTDNPDGDKTGAYLLLRSSVIGPLQDFLLQADMRSDGPGGIGLLFRFVDATNFGFVLFDEPGGWRILGRRTQDSGALFERGARDSSAGFAPGQWLRVALLAQGSRFELTVNESLVLSAEESALSEGGQVGFFCRKNPTARFRKLRVTNL